MSFELSQEHPFHDLVNEKVSYQNPLLTLKVWEIFHDKKDPLTSMDQHHWHYHKEVEFLAIIEGNLSIQSKYNYYSLSDGDVMLMGASQPHRSCKEHHGVLRYIVLQVDLVKHFDRSILPYLYCFSELTNPLEVLNYIFTTNDQVRKEAHQLILEIYEETQAQKKGYEIAINAAIKKLILLLVRNDDDNELHFTESQDITRLKPVIDYIDQHLEEKILVEDACRLVNFSYHYFIKYFKKTMGISFVDYIHLKRIKKAELLLLTTNKSILDICYEVGYSSIAQFYKLFKRQNQCSPKVFKDTMLNNTTN